jgi:hypothetical protein
MSKIAFTPDNSGTGTFTIASPNSNTDRTLTLPDATGTVVYADASGNVGIGVTPTGAKLDVSANAQTTARFTGSGATFVGIANQTAFSSGSVYSGVYYDVRNELGNTVANLLADVNADGSSAWVLSTQPAGTRTDRRVDRLRISSGGDLQFNSGYGSVATAYGCRAWVNFNGTGTVAIRASGNVSSITDNGTGAYTVNFATAMPDASYAYSHSYSNEVNVQHTVGFLSSMSAGSLSVVHYSAADSARTVDKSFVLISVFR